MANGQIPQALQYFTQYLQQENARLEQEEKERNINTAISQTATKFEKLGPEATQEDARSLLFESIRVASETDAPEAIPFIQGVYSDSVNFIERNRALRQSEALNKAISEEFGIDAKGLTGEQKVQYLQLLSSMTAPVQTQYDTPEGTTISGIKHLSFKKGKWVDTGDFTPTGMVDWKARAMTEAKIRLSGESNKAQKTTLISSDKKHKLYFDPGRGQNYYWENNEKVFTEDPGIVQEVEYGAEQRLQNINVKTKDQALNSAQVSARGLAATLKGYGALPKELRGIIREIETGEITAETFAIMRGLAESGNLEALVAEVPKGGQEEILDPNSLANIQLRRLRDDLITLEAAEYEELANIGVPRKDVGNIPIGNYVKHYTRISELLTPEMANTPAGIEMRRLVAKGYRSMGKSKLTDQVTLDDFEELPPAQKQLIINILQKHEKR